MGDIFTNFSVPKTLNLNENQVTSDLKRATVQQSFKDASAGLQRAQSIFSQNSSAFSSTENAFMAKVFEEAIAEKAYQSVEKDLSNLRFKEKVFTNTQTISENKFVQHEKALQMNPEIQGIENQIVENKVKIQDKQKALSNKTSANTVYQNALKVSANLTKEIISLQSSEFTLVNDISSIKAQINNIKSGKISLSDLQINITGSASTSAVDTDNLIKTNSSSVAVVGGQQVSESKVLQSLLEDLKSNTDVSQAQEEIEAEIKKAIIESLEQTLDQKQEDLTKTRQQIKTKQTQLDNNQKKVDKYEVSGKENTDDRTNIEKELEELIQENLDLIEERLKKDPELIKFSSMTNFFNNAIKGNGDTGLGFKPDLAKTREESSERQEIYEETSSQSSNYEKMFDIKSFLKNEAKSNLSSSKLQTEQEKKLLESIKNKTN